MCNEDILSKIQKILAKTVANGATPAEEQAAILMAQRLAAKYQVNLDELNQEEYKIEEQSLDFSTKSVSAIQKYIVTELMPHFGVRAILKRTYDGRHILFTVGESFKCKIFKETVMYVYKSFQFHWSNYHKNLNIPTSAKNDARGTYLKGFMYGFTQALHEQENKYAIVPVESEELKTYMVTQKYTKKSSFKVRSEGISSDFESGYHDGFTSYNKHSQLT